MNITLNYGSGVLTLPSSVTSNLSLADSIDIKTLLLLASDSSLRALPDPSAEIASRIDCRADKVTAAIKYWSETGIIKVDSVAAESVADVAHEAHTEVKEDAPAAAPSAKSVKLPLREIPTYTGEQVELLLDKEDGGLRRLLSECQEISGRVYNVLETNKIIALSDYLGLSNEHILMLFTYCKTRDKTSVHYIEKMAYNLYDEGIDSFEKLDAYIRRKEEYESLENQLRSMFGFGSRAFSTREKKFIQKWIYEFKFTIDMLRRGYEVTVDGTRDGNFNISYMNSVLENWHNSGFTTVEQVEASQIERKKEKQSENGSFDTDEFVKAALKKSSELQ